MQKGSREILLRIRGQSGLTHGAFAIAGTRFSAFGISYTPALNTTAAVVWAVISAFLFYYAWLKKQL